MQHAKLDAALSNALADPSADRLVVFVSLEKPLPSNAVDELRRFGLTAAGERRIVSATLPRKMIDALSDLPWVRSISLSGSSRMLQAV